MTCIISDETPLPPNTNFIVYDLEAVGDARMPSQCRIWNIAAIRLSDGEKFNAFVDPQSEEEYPEPPHPDLFRVTKAFLREKNARPFREVGREFFEWANRGPVVLISHGNFMLDKPLLEYEYGRQGIALPHAWAFFDTLPWFRATMRKEPSYSLKNLYRSAFLEDIPNQHFALPDAEALVRLLGVKGHELRGVVYPPYYTPLQRVKFIGPYNELVLVENGVQCVEDLHQILLQHCSLDLGAMIKTLENRFKINTNSAYKIANSVLHMLLIPKP